MARYIDVDVLMKELERETGIVIVPIITPEIDVQEVKHGKWIKNEKHGYYECSNCKSIKPYDGIGEEYPDNVTYWTCNYCPNCGVEMDEKE